MRGSEMSNGMWVVNGGTVSHQDFTPSSPEGAVVKRRAGFGADPEFVAEVTKQTTSGECVTVREYGHTREGALARAKLAAGRRLTGRKRAAGFTAEGFRDDTRVKAPFKMGFAAT